MRLSPFAALLALTLPQLATAGDINLSFYGWDSQLVGCYAEQQNSEVVLFWERTIGPEFGGSIYHFGFRSRSHDFIGCDLANTGMDEGCAGYDLTAWLEPGAIIIGHVDHTLGDQNAYLEGERWEGHVPTDFDSIRVEYVSGGPCDEPRTLVIPIRWADVSSVPTPPDGSSIEEWSWGELKVGFRDRR